MKVLLTTLNAKYIHKNLALRWLYVSSPIKESTVIKEYTIKDDLLRVANEIISEKITFLVTPNLLVQFYHQKPLFYGSLTGVCVIVVGTSLIYKRKRKSS